MTLSQYRIDSHSITIEDKIIMYVELFSDDTPTLPLIVEDIKNLPQIIDPSKIQFEVGSFIYVINSGDIYFADENGEFVKQ